MRTAQKSAACSNENFIELFEAVGPREAARRLGIAYQNVMGRRKVLEGQIRRSINAPRASRNGFQLPKVAHPHRLDLKIANGIVLIGSDAHIWPGPCSTAMRAFAAFCKEFKPAAVIMNGDVMDFPKVSRHPPIGWENTPNVIEEIEAAQEQLHLVEKATFRARKLWMLGNHDARFETRLATVAPEFARVHGVHLRDHFPAWEPGWSAFINDRVVVKHRFKGGMHAPHNNALWAGRTMVTGHLHSAKVSPITDYNGTRWGVDTGCLADTQAKAFIDYTEDNPKNWIAGFGVFTFRNSELLPPELVTVWDEDRVAFRGELIKVPK